jgi:heme exporter protein D
MLDLGRHAVFIWLSYAAVALVMSGLIGWLLIEGRRQMRRLVELEARGVRRRSSPGSGTGVPPATPEPRDRP